MAAILCLGCQHADASALNPAWVKGASGITARWAALPTSLCIAEPPRDLGLAHGELTETVNDAVRAWGLEGRVRVVPCEPGALTSEDGVNTLMFSSAARGRASDPHGRTILYTRRIDSSAKVEEIIEADVELYVSAVRETLRHGRGALESIVIHELGHVWGLAHSCSFLDARPADSGVIACTDLLAAGVRPAMFPIPDAGAEVVTHPTSEEKATVQAAYGSERRRGWLRW